MSGTIATTIDYSQDELDALADAFGVRWLGSARLAGPRDAVVEATLATALRGLVARRALLLEGTAASPRVRFLEPHATLLGTFVQPERIVRLEVHARARFERRLVFVRDGVAVEQQRTPSAGILRMTARPAAALEAIALDVLAPADHAAPAERRPLEVMLRALDADSETLAAQGAAPPLVDLAHARRRRVTLVDTVLDGRRVATLQTSWIDAGTLGWWRVEPEGDPAVLARLVPVAADEVRTALETRSPAPA
jgi:hypothetical protein